MSGRNEEEGAREKGGGASPETREWVARRDEAREAADEDRRTARREQAERDGRLQHDYQNPAALGCGVIVLFFLLAAGLFVLDAMKCNSMFSDSGLSRSKDCRQP